MNPQTSSCKIEIDCIDPEPYTSIVNHTIRKNILKILYRITREGPVSKQRIADELGIGYHQLVYQLNNQLKEFWTVKEEKKVRGTRLELIEPSRPSTVFITVGKNNSIFMVDPLANIFGPLSRVGTRCDSCTEEDAEKCMDHIRTRCDCAPAVSKPAESILRSNGRKLPYRPMDFAVLCALEMIIKGEKCVMTIPCQTCAFMRRIIQIV